MRPGTEKGQTAMGMTGYFFRADDEILRKIKNGSTADIVFHSDMEDYLLDIDKTWHAIHFTITGSPYDGDENDVLTCLIFGQDPVNDDDLGYGPATTVEKETVVQISAALKEWDKEKFHEKFNLQSMIEHNIYPVMAEEDEEEFFTYVWEYFVFLKEFYQKAADEGQYVLTFIC